ncbi:MULTISPECIES: hypothetical protein [Sphingobacterium]|uniref:Uncharacterized protein n=1 Tax=Sphingobacterium kitahiroshimense TaxID=470446 RepID=A0ABV0C004_9SPHI|nr:hypothetical protein [Sphingobacterium sp. JUb56]MBB2951522.1 hypothetical protein [Sphingobacterium sp. JUb56]
MNKFTLNSDTAVVRSLVNAASRLLKKQIRLQFPKPALRSI